MDALIDASVLVAISHSKEPSHQRCVNTISAFRGNLIIPVACLPEATYLLRRRYGHYAMRAFVQGLQNPLFRLESIIPQDLKRIDQLLQQYADLQLDFADCAIVSAAERLNISTLFTLGHRDFHVVRPDHTDYFNILPA